MSILCLKMYTEPRAIGSTSDCPQCGSMIFRLASTSTSTSSITITTTASDSDSLCVVTLISHRQITSVMLHQQFHCRQRGQGQKAKVESPVPLLRIGMLQSLFVTTLSGFPVIAIIISSSRNSSLNDGCWSFLFDCFTVLLESDNLFTKRGR